MPNYDVECAECGFTAIESIKLADIETWDRGAQCPRCTGGGGVYRRIVRQVPDIRGGIKASTRSEISKKQSIQADFVSSGKKDDMRHAHAKRVDSAQIAQAVENVKKGAFEGF